MRKQKLEPASGQARQQRASLSLNSIHCWRRTTAPRPPCPVAHLACPPLRRKEAAPARYSASSATMVTLASLRQYSSTVSTKGCKVQQGAQPRSWQSGSGS